MRVAAIVPAYNEEHTLARVLDVLVASPDIDEVIVVDDGSSDRTAEVARGYKTVTVIVQPNAGKGAAMKTGAKAAHSDVIFFADADLVGLTLQHLHALISPVQRGEATMTVGLRDRGAFLTWFLPKVAPVLGGERALRKDVFLDVARLAGNDFGIETVMNAYCEKRNLVVNYIVTRGLTQVIKEKKYGLWKGFIARINMVIQILRAEIFTLRMKI